ncbi:MAG: tetratricopeptide repeat protein, partial [Candidatus Eisenbacteria bacterium]|nr:tetratricopeptide repeat protein [Candidatus Eisenbacteria bacterium]
MLRRLAAIECRHGLVRSSGRRFVFDHHEVQQALYDGQFAPLREQYHLALARVAEEREEATAAERTDSSATPHGGDREQPGVVAAFVAEHFLRGGDGERARRHLGPAMRHLEGTYANDAAVRLARLALDCPGLLTGLDRAEILTLEARCLAIQGRSEEEESPLREQFQLAEESRDSKARANAHALLGDLELRRSRLDEAYPLLVEADRLGAEVGDLTVRYFSQIDLGLLFLRQGRLAEAKAACENGLTLAVQTGNGRNEATASGHLGMVLGSQGRHEEARTCFERS